MRKGETSKKAGLIKEGALEFLLSIRESGVTLPKEDEELLIRNGLIKPKLAKKPKAGQRDVNAVGARNKSDFQREASLLSVRHKDLGRMGKVLPFST